MKARLLFLSFFFELVLTFCTHAGEIGHLAPGVLNIRDFAMQEPGFYDQVHAVGGQLDLTYAPRNAALNFHYFYEFAAEDRFQGQSIGLNFTIKF